MRFLNAPSSICLSTMKAIRSSIAFWLPSRRKPGQAISHWLHQSTGDLGDGVPDISITKPCSRPYFSRIMSARRWQACERCDPAFLQRLDSSQISPAGIGWPGFHWSTQVFSPS